LILSTSVGAKHTPPDPIPLQPQHRVTATPLHPLCGCTTSTHASVSVPGLAKPITMVIFVIV
jgi:hypothetical protein